MKVFISWSGKHSHGVALVLRDWLPSVLQHLDAWVSSEDIDKGARWTAALGNELDASNFGIICLVPGNVTEPWLNFEAGVISRAIDTARVAPFLVGMDRRDVTGPLAQFQSTVFEKEDVRKLVHSINRASERQVAGDRLDRTFDACWPDLTREIEGLAIPTSIPERHSELFAASESKPADPVLSEQEVAVLKTLANSKSGLPADFIRSLIRQNATRTEYYLDRLREQNFIHQQQFGNSRATHYNLSAKGRKYLVENGLV